jgi:hypothetical protein
VASRSQLHSRTIWGATPPKVYSPESLQNAGFYAGSPCGAGTALGEVPGGHEEKATGLLEAVLDHVHKKRPDLDEADVIKLPE